MIDAADIANAFCEDIGEQFRHPKCTTFFMTPEQVYDKVEAMCEKAYEATDGHEKMEFSESLLWEIIATIKKTVHTYFRTIIPLAKRRKIARYAKRNRASMYIKSICCVNSANKWCSNLKAKTPHPAQLCNAITVTA